MANGDDKEVVTRSMLNEAVDAILEGMSKLVEELRSDTNKQFESLKGEIDGLKADLFATASRSELEEFKSKLN
jgi:hypothetical protein